MTAIQDHLEDGVALSKSPEEREFLAGILQQIRDARKKVLDKLRETPKSEEAGECPTCKKKGNPEMEKLPSGFEKEQIKPAKYFDPSSFRTLCPECPGQRCSECPPELEPVATRVIIGCKAGEFVEGRCQIGTEKHVVLHNPEHNPGKIGRFERIPPLVLEEIEPSKMQPRPLESRFRERLTLINKEYGHVTVIEPTKKGTKFIYGVIVLPAEYGEPERLGREDRWEIDKYRILPGARWDLHDQERAYGAAKSKFEDERRSALWECENQGRRTMSKCLDEWDLEHPAPKHPLIESL